MSMPNSPLRSRTRTRSDSAEAMTTTCTCPPGNSAAVQLRKRVVAVCGNSSTSGLALHASLSSGSGVLLRQRQRRQHPRGSPRPSSCFLLTRTTLSSDHGVRGGSSSFADSSSAPNRCSVDDIVGGRSMRLFHRTMSLSGEVRASGSGSGSSAAAAAVARYQHQQQYGSSGCSNSLASTPTMANLNLFPGILAGVDNQPALPSVASNFVRLSKSGNGRSAPDLCTNQKELFGNSANNSSNTMTRQQLLLEQAGVAGGASSSSFIRQFSSPAFTNSGRCSHSSSIASPHAAAGWSTNSSSACSNTSMQSMTTAMSKQTGSPVALDSARNSPFSHNLPAHLRRTCTVAGHDARRWSLASMPSSGYGSGYGINTPGSGSSVSSQFSSKENIHHGQTHQIKSSASMHFGLSSQPALLQPSHQSNTSTSSAGGGADFGAATEDSKSNFNSERMSPYRLRSRSLSSSARTSASGGVNQDLILMNHVYQERFPKATAQMEEKLINFIHKLDEETLSEEDPIAHFVHMQMLEICRDCLQTARAQRLSSRYFFDMTEKVDQLLEDTRAKSPAALGRVLETGRRLLLVIARPARLLECLEFDPAEFYQLLEAAEGQVREHVNATAASVPHYIISKLGLNRPPLEDMNQVAAQLLDDNVDSVAPPQPSQPLITEEDFEIIKLISNGAYGAVHLVRHKATRRRFALKRISMHLLRLRNQVEQVFAERDIMTFADNPFVVSMICTFTTRKHLCMVMEYVEGGDCGALLKNIGTFPLDTASMYFAETLLALEYLHNYGIVHRDLKPDNLLITAEGHIKLTDFGLSKMGLMNRTTSLYESSVDEKCSMFRDHQVYGTPEYIAPEVVLRQGYGKPVDWWAMGIILYQFLVGCVPFYGDTPEELFEMIVSEQALAAVEWPEGEDQLPSEVEDLIQRLLQRDPVARLGTQGAQDVKRHAFFEGIDWNGLLRLKAAFVPCLEGEEDTSYFDTRADRYQHHLDSFSADSELDEDVGERDTLLQSFSSFSPRFSRLGSSDVRSASAEGSDSSSLDLSAHGSLAEEESSPELATRRSMLHPSPSPTVPPRLNVLSSRQRSDSSPGSNGSVGVVISPSSSVRRTNSYRRNTAGVSPLAADATVTTVQKSASANQLQTLLITAPQMPPLSPDIMSGGGGCGSTQAELKPPLIIRRSQKGFGFTMRAIRVYLGETAARFVLHHLVVAVTRGSPSWEAGLREGDLITHVNDSPVSGLAHTEVVTLITGGGSRLSLRATPLERTSIRSEGRRHHPYPTMMRRSVVQRHSSPQSGAQAVRPALRTARNWNPGQHASHCGVTSSATMQRSYSHTESLLHQAATPLAPLPTFITYNNNNPTAALRLDCSGSSGGSSPISSGPNSPSALNCQSYSYYNRQTMQSRPSSLNYVPQQQQSPPPPAPPPAAQTAAPLRSKTVSAVANANSPRRKSMHCVPPSPLARTPSSPISTAPSSAPLSSTMASANTVALSSSPSVSQLRSNVVSPALQIQRPRATSTDTHVGLGARRRHHRQHGKPSIVDSDVHQQKKT